MVGPSLLVDAVSGCGRVIEDLLCLSSRRGSFIILFVVLFVLELSIYGPHKWHHVIPVNGTCYVLYWVMMFCCVKAVCVWIKLSSWITYIIHLRDQKTVFCVWSSGEKMLWCWMQVLMNEAYIHSTFIHCLLILSLSAYDIVYTVQLHFILGILFWYSNFV